jgi:glycosyltransferase 2 family protein
MKDIVKKIAAFKGWRYIFAAILLFLVFKNVDFLKLINNIRNVSLGLIVLTLFFNLLSLWLTSYRWALLVLNRVTIADINNFWRANMEGSFYNLVFPSTVVGDCIKWLPIHKKYPHLSKGKCLTSSLLDRAIGMMTFIVLGFLMLILGKMFFGFFNLYLFLIIGFSFLAMIVFIICVFTFDIKKIFMKIKFLNKFVDVLDLIGHENKKHLLFSFLVSLFCQILGILSVVIIANLLHINLPIITILVFMPIISILSVLPISVAGFGGREYLFVFFFSNFDVSSEKLLFLSTFIGVAGILSMLCGGLYFLFDKNKYA